MLVSPDRLGWTYGGSLAADSRSRCQLLRNVHTLSRTYTHAHANTHQSCFVSVVQSSKPPWLPAVRLSQNPLRTSVVGILEPPCFFPSPLLAKGWTAVTNARPQRGRMGWQMRAKSGEHKALFKEQTGMDCLPPSHLCVCVFCLARVRVSSFCMFCLVPVLTAGLEILSKSHRLSSEWNREVLLGGQPDNVTACCLIFIIPVCKCRAYGPFSYCSDPNWTCFCCFIWWWCCY